VVAGVGYYRGWFNFAASVNEDKIKEDLHTVKDKVHDLGHDKTIDGTIHQIGTGQELTIRDSQKKDVTIKVDAATKIKIGDKDSPFSDLKTDDPVSVKYEAKKDENVARTITVSKKS